MFNISYFQSVSLLQCTDSVISLESKLGELGIYMYVNVLPSCMFIYNKKKASDWSALSIDFLYQYHCVHSKRGFYFYWIWHMTQQFIYKWYTSVSGISENLYRLFTWRLWKQTAFRPLSSTWIPADWSVWDMYELPFVVQLISVLADNWTRCTLVHWIDACWHIPVLALSVVQLFDS